MGRYLQCYQPHGGAEGGVRLRGCAAGGWEHAAGYFWVGGVAWRYDKGLGRRKISLFVLLLCLVILLYSFLNIESIVFTLDTNNTLHYVELSVPSAGYDGAGTDSELSY